MHVQDDPVGIGLRCDVGQAIDGLLPAFDTLHSVLDHLEPLALKLGIADGPPADAANVLGAAVRLKLLAEDGCGFVEVGRLDLDRFAINPGRYCARQRRP
jgi:hypothetical protein